MTSFDFGDIDTSELKEITLDPLNNYYYIENNMVIEKESHTAVLYMSGIDTDEYHFHYSILKVKKRLFYRNQFIKRLYLNKYLERLDDKCFSEMSSLEEVYIDDRIIELGKSLFAKSISLKTIYYFKLKEPLQSEGLFNGIGEVTIKVMNTFDKNSFCNKTISKSLLYNQRCGEYVHCIIEQVENGNNMFLIKGTGKTYDYDVSLFDKTEIQIRSITIDKYITSIGRNMLVDLKEIELIGIHPENSDLQIINGVVYGKGGTELILYPHYIEELYFFLPLTVTYIYPKAFHMNKKLRHVFIQNDNVVIADTQIVDIEQVDFFIHYGNEYKLFGFGSHTTIHSIIDCSGEICYHIISENEKQTLFIFGKGVLESNNYIDEYNYDDIIISNDVNNNKISK